MDLSRILPPATSETRESLTAALVALLRAAGGDAAAHSVSAALGVSFVTLATTDPDPAEWVQAGRDFNLEPAAALFGIRLRDLHPRDAAAGLRQAPEYQQHFADSYYPLIRRALDHGECVLAHRGWAGAASRNWGIISDVEPGGRLVGMALGGAGATLLESAADQCYVVEQIAPRKPVDAEITGCAIDGCARLAAEGCRGDVRARVDVWRMITARIGDAKSARSLAAYFGEVAAVRAEGVALCRSVRNHLQDGHWRVLEQIVVKSAETVTNLARLLRGCTDADDRLKTELALAERMDDEVFRALTGVRAGQAKS